MHALFRQGGDTLKSRDIESDEIFEKEEYFTKLGHLKSKTKIFKRGQLTS